MTVSITSLHVRDFPQAKSTCLAIKEFTRKWKGSIDACDSTNPSRASAFNGKFCLPALALWIFYYFSCASFMKLGRKVRGDYWWHPWFFTLGWWTLYLHVASNWKWVRGVKMKCRKHTKVRNTYVNIPGVRKMFFAALMTTTKTIAEPWFMFMAAYYTLVILSGLHN